MTDPPTSSIPSRSSVGLLLAAVLLIAVNMRATITGLGPLLTQIGESTGLAAAALGLLAAIPLMTWAIVSPFAHELSRRYGTFPIVLTALILLALGTVWRSLPGSTWNLWAGTALIGVAIAVANVLLPAVIKRGFPGSVPRTMALYSAVLGGCGALASGLVVPISQLPSATGTLGWEWALLATGVVVIPAVILWCVAARRWRDTSIHHSAGTSRRIWRDPTAWVIAAYMGAQSACFYILVTWLAPISASSGRSDAIAGLDVMAFQVVGILGSLVVPPLLGRSRSQRFVAPAVAALGAAGVVGLLLIPTGVLWWALLTGFAAGASLGLALTFMAVRARDASAAAALSGMAQSFGYLVASAGPLTFGWLRQATDTWTAPLLFLLALMIAQGAFGLAVRHDRFVLERP